MQTSWFTETLRADLEAVGSMGSEKSMKVVDRMIQVTLPLARGRMLEALSMALGELSGALGIEGIDLRVSGDDVTFVPAEHPQEPAPPVDQGAGEQARFSLRLPDDLKSLIDDRANAEGVSTNTWIVRALYEMAHLNRVRPPSHPQSPRNRKLSGYGRA